MERKFLIAGSGVDGTYRFEIITERRVLPIDTSRSLPASVVMLQNP